MGGDGSGFGRQAGFGSAAAGLGLMYGYEPKDRYQRPGAGRTRPRPGRPDTAGGARDRAGARHQPARPHRDDPARVLPRLAGAPPDRDPAARARRRAPDPRDRPRPRRARRRLRRGHHRRRPGARPHQGPARPAARRRRRRREAAQERPRRGRHRGARDRDLRRARGARPRDRRRRDGAPRRPPSRPGGAHARAAAQPHPEARQRRRAGARDRQGQLRLGDHGRGRHGPQDGPQRAAQGHDHAAPARHEGREAAGGLRQAERERGGLQAHGLHARSSSPRWSPTSAPTASARP